MEKRRMVVLKLITGLNVGGAEMMLYKTVKNMDRGKYKLIVVSLLPIGEVGKLIKDQGIPVYSLEMEKGLSIFAGTARFLKLLLKERPHIIHSYMFHANFLGRICGKITGIPVIIDSIRNENIGGRLREKLLGLSDFLVDGVTVVSKKAGETQCSQGTFNAKKLKVIYNGIELEKFNSQPPEVIDRLKGELQIPKDHKILITVGRLEPLKNHKMLLQSFAEVLSNFSNCTLLVVGDGNLKNELITIAENLGIGENVIFTGIRHDIPALLAISDLFVLASSWEGLPNVLIEAMAARKPVIATAVGGVPEVLTSQQVGCLVKPNNHKLMTKSILKMLLLTNSEKEKIGVNARRLIEEKFTIERTILETEKLYYELLRKKGL